MRRGRPPRPSFRSSTINRPCNCCSSVSCVMLRLGTVMKTIARPGLRSSRISEKVRAFPFLRRRRCPCRETRCPRHRECSACALPTCSARHAVASARDETVVSSASSPPAQVQRCCVPTVRRARYEAHYRAAATPPGRAIRDVVHLVSVISRRVAPSRG